MVVTGKAKYLTLKAVEHSRVDTRELDSVAAEVDAAAGSEVFVSASERLLAQARSGATIYHRGNPSILKNRSARSPLSGGIFSVDERLTP